MLGTEQSPLQAISFLIRNSLKKRRVLFPLLSRCWRLNARAPPPQFICWNPNPHSDGIWRWGHWEAVRSGRWNPHEWNLYPVQRDRRESISLSTMWRHRKLTAVCKPGGELSPGTESTSTLNLDSQPPELGEINVCCLSHLVYGMFLWQHELKQQIKKVRFSDVWKITGDYAAYTWWNRGLHMSFSDPESVFSTSPASLVSVLTFPALFPQVCYLTLLGLCSTWLQASNYCHSGLGRI